MLAEIYMLKLEAEKRQAAGNGQTAARDPRFVAIAPRS